MSVEFNKTESVSTFSTLQSTYRCKRERGTNEENEVESKAHCAVERLLPIAHQRIRPKFKHSDRLEMRRKALSNLYTKKSHETFPSYSLLSIGVGQLRHEVNNSVPPSEEALKLLSEGSRVLKGQLEKEILETGIEQLRQARSTLAPSASETEHLSGIDQVKTGLKKVETVLTRVTDILRNAQIISEDILKQT